MTEVIDIIERVNTRVPGYGLEVIAPSEIIDTRRTSCFGMVILVAAGLLSEGLCEESAMNLIISQAHGRRTPTGKIWYGHAAAILGPDFVDADVTAFLGSREGMNWDDPLHPYNPFQVRVAQNDKESSLPRELRERQYRYTQLPIEDGVAAYQQGHKELQAANPPWVLEDYVNAYKALVQS